MRGLTTMAVTLGILGAGALPATAVADQGIQAPWATPVATEPAGNFTLLIAYAFGYHREGDTFTPGTINEQLADTVVATLGHRDIPVYAQTEIAEVLKNKYGMNSVHSIGAATMAEVERNNPRTIGVAQVVAGERAASKETDTVGVIAFQDHLWRATRTTMSVGFRAYAPAGIPMPDVYAADNDQETTKTPEVYRPMDTAASIPFLVGTGSAAR
ncbi:hypothetical protein [Nocardia acidivorans]|uniref:hypothetical protein n=1 Tax=Nocardia acidivorans TaxID=404580 RepID=UPI000A06A3D7|nr:hypothetical protein [Nocardia acidivorans]